MVLSAEGRGGPGDYSQGSHRPRYVLALEHRSSTSSFAAPRGTPKLFDQVTWTCGRNLDVFRMFPSIEAAGRRFAPSTGSSG